MPEWETHPFDNFPQTPQEYFKQVEQELEALERRREYLLEERIRIVTEIERIEGEDTILR